MNPKPSIKAMRPIALEPGTHISQHRSLVSILVLSIRLLMI